MERRRPLLELLVNVMVGAIIVVGVVAGGTRLLQGKPISPARADPAPAPSDPASDAPPAPTEMGADSSGPRLGGPQPTSSPSATPERKRGLIEIQLLDQEGHDDDEDEWEEERKSWRKGGRGKG